MEVFKVTIVEHFETPPAIIGFLAIQSAVVPPAQAARRLRAWLDAPLSGLSCALGWCLATVLFMGVTAILGGPGLVDWGESGYSTWAVAHAQFSCVFPSAALPGEPLIAPVYVFYSGAIAAITSIGHAVPFPSRAALGPHCDTMYAAVGRWWAPAGALVPTLRIAYTSWLFLTAGLIAWLRSSGRGKCGWEPATLVVVACLPPVWTCVVKFFHPQDLVAMGFVLAAMACTQRDRWSVAGALIALAVLTQQYALLVAVPLLMLAPAGRRVRYSATAAVTVALIVLPLLVATSGHALRALALGSGNGPFYGITVLGKLDLPGLAIVLLSRILPVALAGALAWWVVRRLGTTHALRPVTLLSVVALSLSLRLVFEQNLYSYYFMALVVTLVLLDIVRGHIRASLVAWLGGLTVLFLQEPYFQFFFGFPWTKGKLSPFLIVFSVALAAILVVRRSMTSWRLALCLAVVTCALVTWPVADPFPFRFPLWFWQVVFVGSGVALAGSPLLTELRTDHHSDDVALAPG